ncbi:Ig-like domain-containing protein [Desulfallas sp. Bu1-1]|uniref:Ig-like domain-containing protein n=1 Tax=Desulfallas sp. Bu1-1 TaxID=2787620 RepID=UPI0018A0CB8E|nr:Ig-like domain-containing protein [Desulfallas sp. Bu1-1]MBF7081656.1 Ig-like domain-containing protein [Desulfallas sp. Bu1-1]
MTRLFKRAIMTALLAALVVFYPVQAAPAGSRPNVEDHYPGKDAGDVPVNVVIMIEFSEEMDEQSVLEGFTLRDEDGRAVSGSVTYDAASHKAYFKPDQSLKYNTKYRVRLSGSIEDADGDNLAYYSFDFTTARDARMYVDGIEVTGKSIYVNNSPVDITLDVPGAEKVIYGEEELENRGDEYYLEDVVLKPGANSFTFKITYEYEDDTGETREETISFSKQVYFVNTLEDGAVVTYNLHDGNKVSVFDKKLNIVFPKNYYLREGNGAAHSQVMAFKLERIYQVNGSPAVSYLFNVGHVRGKEGDYRYDCFGENCAVAGAPPGGQMTLPVDEDLAEAAYRTLTVFYDAYDGLAGNWRNLGGRADAKKKTVAVPFEGFGRYVVVNRLWTFRDQVGWPARPCVEYLWARGIMSPAGTAPGYFGLTDQQGKELNATRGEFVVMLGKALGLKTPGDDVGLGIFSDVFYLSGHSYGYSGAGALVPLPRDHVKYIEAAAKNGIVSGFREKDGRFVFRYFDSVTREQAAAIIAAAAGLPVSGAGERVVDWKLSRMFKDYQNISPGARPYVLEAVSGGYMQGFPDWTFRPGAGLTRIEAAEMVYKLMEKKKLL